MRYTRERLEEAVQNSDSISQVLRHLGIPVSGGMHKHIKTKICLFGISTSHFTGAGRGWAKGVASNKRLSPEDLLVELSGPYRAKTYQLRRALLDTGRPYLCQVCGLGPSWNGLPLVLEIDHVNGSWRDCRKENLRFLCPNCHAQTTTFRSGNLPRRVVPVESGIPIKSPTQFNSEHADRTKIVWPSEEALRDLVERLPLTEIAKRLGVSGVAVKKRCKKLGIETKRRGQWGRNQFNMRA